MERRVGEVFEFEGKRIMAILSQGYCLGCYFMPHDCDMPSNTVWGDCKGTNRIDGNPVAFIEVKEAEPLEQVAMNSMRGMTLDQSAYQPTDEVIECPVPDADACHNRYNGARLGDEECSEVDRPGLTLADMDRAASQFFAEMRAEREPSDFERIASEVGKLTFEKNCAYGNSFAMSGEFLKLLYPDGLKPDQYGDALLLVRIFDKQMRIANNAGAFGESPYRDIVGYGLCGAREAE